MSEQLFEVSGGLSLDNAIQMIYGSGAPGATVETNAAPVGSSYNDTVDGAKWQKVSNLDGVSGWVELAGKDAAIVVEHIASTGVILDQVPVKKATEFAWAITAVNEADLTNKYSCLVHMSHNGTVTEDATNVTFDQSSILRQGVKIAGLQVTGTLTGTGDTQFMNLHVSSQSMVTFIAYRMVKNIAGSNTVILGGASLDNHVADGSVHLMPWQNTLLDGLSQSLNATQVNSLLGIASNVQTQLNAKADASSVEISLSGKADTTTVNNSLALKQNALGFTPYDASNPNGYQTSAQVATAVAGATTTSTASITTWTGTPYDLGISVFGVPAASEVVYRFLITRPMTIASNFTNSLAKTATVATASTVFSVQKNGTPFGTVTFAAGSATGTFSTQGAISFAAGDRVSVVAPSTVDITLADTDITINAVLA